VNAPRHTIDVRHRCAWKGCKESYPLDPGLPKNWRWLCVWSGPPGAPPWAQGNVWDRDSVLCPKHAKLLHREILEPLK